MNAHNDNPEAEPHPERGVGRIVVGIDGSDHAEVVLRWAARMASLAGAELDVVTVWQPMVLGWMGESAAYGADDPRGEAEKSLNALVDKVFGAHRPAGLRVVVQEGDPPHRLVSHAGRALMLVLGSHGRGTLSALVLGSVSAACAARATCPVVIVPPAAG